MSQRIQIGVSLTHFHACEASSAACFHDCTSASREARLSLLIKTVCHKNGNLNADAVVQVTRDTNFSLVRRIEVLLKS